MALRDQPYLPLYVQDIMTDEKLNECSAATHGIYIKGLMCLMHKSNTYGKILLKQKFKQNSSTPLNFACQLSKHLPYTVDEVENAINELLEEEVCYLEGDFICQKRMIKDNATSEARAKSGKKGGISTQFAKANLQANTQAPSEYEYENENESYLKGGPGEKNEIEFDNDDKKLEAFLCKNFNVNEITNPDKVLTIHRSICFMKNQTPERYRYFKDNCFFYFKYKALSKEKTHALNSFLGNLDQDLNDGGWNACNWQMKMSELPEDKKPTNIYPGSIRKRAQQTEKPLLSEAKIAK